MENSGLTVPKEEDIQARKFSAEFSSQRVWRGNIMKGWSNGKECDDAKIHSVIRKMGRVIFPDNRWIKIWDSVMLVLMIYVAFVVPYNSGVSGGWRYVKSIAWLIFNTIVNLAFIVDTILYFFRAYRRQDGKVEFDLRQIRRRWEYILCLARDSFEVHIGAETKKVSLKDTANNSIVHKYMGLQVSAESFHSQCHLESTVSERCFQNDFNKLFFPFFLPQSNFHLDPSSKYDFGSFLLY